MPQCHYEGFYIHSNELFRRVRKMGERTDSEQNSNILRLLCNMNERMARKRLFSGAASRRIPDEDPPWALKFPSDVRMMDRDTRTSESVVCACLTLRMRFISRSTRRVIVGDLWDKRCESVWPAWKNHLFEKNIIKKFLSYFNGKVPNYVRKSFSDTRFANIFLSHL